jgi:hypothetical protein
MENGSMEGSEGSPLDKLRRHVRILVDIGRLAGENADLTPLPRPGRRSDRPGRRDTSRKGSSVSSPQLGPPPYRGCRMERRRRS